MGDNRHLAIARAFENTYRAPSWVFDTICVLLAIVIVAHWMV